MAHSRIQLVEAHECLALEPFWTAPQIWLSAVLVAFATSWIREILRRLRQGTVLRGAFADEEGNGGCVLFVLSGGLIRDHDSFFAFFHSGPGGIVPRALPTAAALMRAWDDNALSCAQAIEVLEACLASREDRPSPGLPPVPRAVGCLDHRRQSV